jgi:hypothetical protein
MKNIKNGNGLSTYERTTLSVLKKIARDGGENAVSEEGHKTILRLEDKKNAAKSKKNNC